MLRWQIYISGVWKPSVRIDFRLNKNSMFSLWKFTVFLSFLKRERYFVIVSGRPTFLSVLDRSWTSSVSWPFLSFYNLKNFTNGVKRSWNVHATDQQGWTVWNEYSMESVLSEFFSVPYTIVPQLSSIVLINTAKSTKNAIFIKTYGVFNAKFSDSPKRTIT